MSEVNNLSDVLTNLNVDFKSSDDFLERLFEYDERYIVSLYPGLITDSEKYEQVEIFYSKYSKRDNIKEFTDCENRFHEFIKTLWLYNDVYVAGFETYKNIVKACSKLGFSRLKRNEKEFIKNISSDFDIGNNRNMVLATDFSLLKKMITLATRELSGLLLYFKQSNFLLYFFGCEGLLILEKDARPSKALSDILCHNQLYIWSGLSS